MGPGISSVSLLAALLSHRVSPFMPFMPRPSLTRTATGYVGLSVLVSLLIAITIDLATLVYIPAGSNFQYRRILMVLFRRYQTGPTLSTNTMSLGNLGLS